MSRKELYEVEIVVPGRADHLVPRAPALPRRLPVPRAAVRGDPGGGRVRPGRGGAPDPRGPAHVRGPRPRQGARPRRVVAARDGPAASARGERRAPRSRRRRALRRLRGAARGDPVRARPPRGGARVRAPVRPGHRRRGRRPLRLDVRERADAGLRRRGPQGRHGAPAPGRGARRVPAPVARRLRRR